MAEHFYICPKCDFIVRSDESLKYCVYCGSPLIISCPHGGQEITNPYGAFCGRCGGRLRPEKDKEG